MIHKCKVCGYIFKNDDEIICPECLTAREDDISCNSYSDKDHSHKVYDDKSDSLFDYIRQDDTYKDDNSFIEEEQREERKDKFANKVQDMAYKAAGQNSGTNRQQTYQYNNQNTNRNTYQNTNQNVNQFPNYQRQGTQQNFGQGIQPNFVAPKKNNNNKIAKIIIGSMVAIFVFRFLTSGIFSIVFRNISDNIKDSASSYISDFSIVTPDNDLPQMFTEKGKYFLELTDTSIPTYLSTDYDELDKSEKESILDQKEHLGFYKQTVEFNLTNLSSDSNKYPVVVSVICMSYDSDGVILSRTKPINGTELIGRNTEEKKDTYTADVFMDEDFETSQIIITIKYDGKTTSYTMEGLDSDNY